MALNAALHRSTPSGQVDIRTAGIARTCAHAASASPPQKKTKKTKCELGARDPGKTFGKRAPECPHSRPQSVNEKQKVRYVKVKVIYRFQTRGAVGNKTARVKFGLEFNCFFNHSNH